MKSALYIGEVVHHRYRPVKHSLRYGLFWMLLDLDELPVMGSLLFGHNRRHVMSFHDRDHLDGSATPLRLQIERLLDAAGLEPDGGPIRVLCMPRLLGRAFNPISVWFCHRRDGALSAMLYEVNNTFGERHSYLIPVADPAARIIRQSCEKRFYVSPFMQMDMVYDFRVAPPGEHTAVVVDGRDDQGKVISASFTGRRRPITDAALAGQAMRSAGLALRVLGAIHWEAMKLWVKGLRLRPRPPMPDDAVTIVSSRRV